MEYYVIHKASKCPYCGYSNRTEFKAVPCGPDGFDGSIIDKVVVSCDGDEGGCNKNYVAELGFFTDTFLVEKAIQVMEGPQQ